MGSRSGGPVKTSTLEDHQGLANYPQEAGQLRVVIG